MVPENQLLQKMPFQQRAKKSMQDEIRHNRLKDAKHGNDKKAIYILFQQYVKICILPKEQKEKFMSFNEFIRKKKDKFKEIKLTNSRKESQLL